MRALLVHLVVYVAVNGLLVVVWIATGGAVEALDSPLRAAREDGFWPLWPAAGWAAALVGHAGIALAVLPRRGDGDSDGDREEGAAWVAAMFTDLTDSTTLAGRLGDEAWAEMIAVYREAVREVAGPAGGREVGTQGDGMLWRFDAPGTAVDCALDLQRRLDDERAAGAEIPPVRVGIHAGRVVARDNDILGQVVNVAARVADVAGPGEVVVTEAVADHAGPQVTFDDRDLVTLDGVPGPRHLLAARRRRG